MNSGFEKEKIVKEGKPNFINIKEAFDPERTKYKQKEP